MRKDACYNSDGRGIKSVECKAGQVYEVPEWVVDTFVKKMKIAELVEEVKPILEQIETPEQPILETKPLDIDGMEYKALLAKAKDEGFENGKGRPSKDSLIEFLRGKDD